MKNKIDLKSKAYEDYMNRIASESIPAYDRSKI